MGMFSGGGGSGGAPPPPVKPAVRIPREDDPDVMVAVKRRMREADEARRGRASTQLTPASDQPYTRTALG